VSVKRYDRQEIYDVTYRAAGDECLPEPSENGEFVLHSDYARFHSLFANSEQSRRPQGAFFMVCLASLSLVSACLILTWHVRPDGMYTKNHAFLTLDGQTWLPFGKQWELSLFAKKPKVCWTRIIFGRNF